MTKSYAPAKKKHMNKKSIASLFDPTPSQWGLRGDPYLWDELRANFSAIPLPESAEKLQDLLEKAFEALTDTPLSTDKKILVIERLAHGGMSSGGVSIPFWRDVVMPLLIERYRNAEEE